MWWLVVNPELELSHVTYAKTKREALDDAAKFHNERLDEGVWLATRLSKDQVVELGWEI